PGPASSQIGMAIGHLRAGYAGTLAAWTAFTMPSAIAMVLFAQSLATINAGIGTSWLHGLKIVAVAVVAQALWGMGRALCPDRPRATIAVGAAAVALLWPSSVGQVAAIAAAGLVALVFLPAAGAPPAPTGASRLSRAEGAVFLGIF